MIDDLAREREIVRERTQTRRPCSGLDDDSGLRRRRRSPLIATCRRTYNGENGQNLVASTFYDRFTDQLEQLLSDLLDNAIEAAAVSHAISPPFDRFRDNVVADATVVRLHRFLSAFPATHPNVPGLKLYLVHSVSTQSVMARSITDKRTHESTLFNTGLWMR